MAEQSFTLEQVQAMLASVSKRPTESDESRPKKKDKPKPQRKEPKERKNRNKKKDRKGRKDDRGDRSDHAESSSKKSVSSGSGAPSTAGSEVGEAIRKVPLFKLPLKQDEKTHSTAVLMRGVMLLTGSAAVRAADGNMFGVPPDWKPRTVYAIHSEGDTHADDPIYFQSKRAIPLRFEYEGHPTQTRALLRVESDLSERDPAVVPSEVRTQTCGMTALCSETSTTSPDRLLLKTPLADDELIEGYGFDDGEIKTRKLLRGSEHSHGYWEYFRSSKPDQLSPSYYMSTARAGRYGCDGYQVTVQCDKSRKRVVIVRKPHDGEKMEYLIESKPREEDSPELIRYAWSDEHKSVDLASFFSVYRHGDMRCRTGFRMSGNRIFEPTFLPYQERRRPIVSADIYNDRLLGVWRVVVDCQPDLSGRDISLPAKQRK